MPSLKVLCAAATLLQLAAAASQIVLFPYSSRKGTHGNPVDNPGGFGNVTAVSAACAKALNQTVKCDPTLQSLASTGASLSPNSTGAGTTLCAAACNTSLTTYHTNVATACGTTPVFGPLLANSWRGDLLQSYFNLVCTKDTKSGTFCPDWLAQQYKPLPTFSNISAVPTDILCSECQVSYFKTLQASPFFGYGSTVGSAWQTAQQICGLSLPTAVNPAANLTFNLPKVPQASANATCASGKTYKVKASDTCTSIALKQSVAEGTLWAINNLQPNCSAMSTGQTICLPNKCSTHAVAKTDTCVSIAAASNNSLASFLRYNPAVNAGCTNLNTTGSVVCTSNPSGAYTPVYVPGSNSTGVGEYATQIVDPPGLTPYGTTTKCGAYYKIQVADTCNRVSLSAGVSVALFELINPSIDADCHNLIPDLWYCVHPIVGWNITIPSNATSTPVTTPAPGPTPSGTTSTCYAWHVIVANDTCTLLQETLGVTLAQLVAWNPNLHTSCDNLIRGDAYCISGPALSTSSSSTTTAKTTKSATATTKTKTKATTTSATTTASACKQTYAVKSGDTCYTIWTAYSLTEAQLRALNPSLDANCDLQVGQVLCVSGAGTTAATSTATTKATTTSHTTTTKATTTSTKTTSKTTTSAAACPTKYTVKSGDTCYAIWTAYSLTEAQLRAMNPSLDANCDLSVGQVLCV